MIFVVPCLPRTIAPAVGTINRQQEWNDARNELIADTTTAACEHATPAEPYRKARVSVVAYIDYSKRGKFYRPRTVWALERVLEPVYQGVMDAGFARSLGIDDFETGGCSIVRTGGDECMVVAVEEVRE